MKLTIIYFVVNALLAAAWTVEQIVDGRFDKESAKDIVILMLFGAPILVLYFGSDLLERIPNPRFDFWVAYVFDRNSLLLSNAALKELVKLYDHYSTNRELNGGGKVVWTWRGRYSCFLAQKQLELNNAFGIKGLTNGIR